MKTLVLVIEKRGAAGGCPVRVYADDGTADWQARPGAEGTIEAGLLGPPWLQAPSGADLRAGALADYVASADRPDPFLDDIGAHLWTVLNPGAVGVFVDAQWATHAKVLEKDTKPGLRVVLDVRDEELRDVPWELMQRANVPVFASPFNPAHRGPLTPQVAPADDSRVMKVLLVSGGSAPGGPSIHVDEEIEALEDALRGFRREIDLHVERNPTRARFIEVFSDVKPHVLHFVGHADLVPRAGGADQAALVFYDGTNTRWDWRLDEIAGTLAVGPPRLAFLNACRTAAARRNVGSLSGEFMNAGVLATIAMRADISGAAAAAMPAEVYGALARGRDLDVALAAARYRVRGIDKRRDWALPALELRVPAAEALPRQAPLSPERQAELAHTPEFVTIQPFVDRRPQRRQFDPLRTARLEPNVLVIDGPSSTGKTWMLLWLLEGCALCDHQVKYVDLRRGRVGFLDVLELVERRESNPISSVREALGGDFTTFRQYAALVRGGPAAGRTPDDPIDSLFAAFRAALVESGRVRPLVIALDHLGSVDPDEFRRYLRPYLIDYVAQGRLAGVRFVLSCDANEYKALQLDTLVTAARTTVTNFTPAEFEALYREYMLARRVPRDHIPPPTMPARVDFSPRLLAQVYDLAVGFGLVD